MSDATANDGIAPAPRHRLAIRLAWLTVAAILLAQAMFFVPSLVRLRRDWLDRRLTEAQLAALSVSVAPGIAVDRGMRDELLRLAGATAIQLQLPDHAETILAPAGDMPAATRIDLRHESSISALAGAFTALASSEDGLISISGPVPGHSGTTVLAVLHRSALHDTLLRQARRIGAISLTVAVGVGLLLYVALLVLLVRPIRQLTQSIAAFRADPERLIPHDDTVLPPGREDEIAAAARELSAMQRELRAALWRNARLAALGVAVAKVNHDLRGILSPAMLTGERLQMSNDASVKRAGDVVVRAVERAAELMRRTLEFAREAPVAVPSQRIELRAAVEEAAEQARAACPNLSVENQVAPETIVEADRDSLVRVLGNLLRNAGEAESLHVSVAAAREADELAIVVGDDGKGLPDAVRAALFRPFVTGGRRGSTGLGLAIVHDLMRAQGGNITLLDTGAGGTRFRLTLPCRNIPAAAPAAVQAG